MVLHTQDGDVKLWRVFEILLAEMALYKALKHEFWRSLMTANTVVNSSVFRLSGVSGLRKVTCVYFRFVGATGMVSPAGLSKEKTFLHGFEDLAELENADENVKRIFSLANASQQQRRKVMENELKNKCNTAQERKIAKMTVSITNLENHLQAMRNKDKHNKIFLQWLKDQRVKKLKSLKMSNFERYIELIKELNVEPLSSTHSKYAKYKFRRFKIGVEIKEKKSLAVRKTPALPKQS